MATPDNLRSAILREEYWEEVRKDERYFIENNFKIRTKEATFENLVYNDNQVVTEAVEAQLLKKYGYVRLAILKYRQWGCSTYCKAKAATKTCSYMNWRTLITAQHKTRAKGLLKEMRQMIYQLPPEYRPILDTENSMELEILDRQSSATIQTAKTPEFGRGDMFNWWWLTEVDFFLGEGGSLKTVMDAGMPFIPDQPLTGVWLESTANGTDGEYYTMWVGAHKGEPEGRGFYALFVGWMNDRKLEMPFHVHAEDNVKYDWEGTKRRRDKCKTCNERRYEFRTLYCKDEDIHERVDKYHLTWEQANWYWYYLQSRAGGDKLKMAQEYPCSWQEAFIASGSPVYDKRLLTALQLRARPGRLFEPPQTNFESLDDDRLIEQEELVRGKDPYFEVWKEPVKDHRYAIGADSSTGKANSNPSAAVVMDCETQGIVAVLHGRIDPETYAHYLARIGAYYNYAVVAPEQQQTGYAVIAPLEKIYSNIHQHHKLRPEGWKEMDSLGFSTDRETRPYMVQLGRKLLTSHARNTESIEKLADLIPCAQLLHDLQFFTYGKMAKPQAAVGEEDDLPMAWMISIAVTHQHLNLGLNEEVPTMIHKPTAEEKQWAEKPPADIKAFKKYRDRYFKENFYDLYQE